MEKYGYVDVFPTRINKIKLDTKILPMITSEENNHSKYAKFSSCVEKPPIEMVEKA